MRIKATGEKTEVNHEVLKFLRAEEKRIRRNFCKNTIKSSENNDQRNTCISLNASEIGNSDSCWWLADPRDYLDDADVRMLEQELKSKLTALQLELYEECIIEGKSLREFSREMGIDFKCAWRQQQSIQKKAKKIFA